MERDETIRQLSVALPIYREWDRLAAKQKKAESGQLGGWQMILLLTIVPTCSLALGTILLILKDYFLQKPFLGVPDIELIIIVAASVLITIWLAYAVRKKKKKQLALVEDEVNTFVQKSYCEELFVLPPDYRYTYACEYILGCFQNMRADTMKEAINLYVEQLDRWKQEKLLANMQRQLGQIASEQKSSNMFFKTAAIIGLMKK